MEKKSSIRFKRISEAFDEEARARICESSGSEHSSSASEEDSSSLDLSDLVHSFLERENDNHQQQQQQEDEEEESSKKREKIENTNNFDSERKHLLQSLLGFNGFNEDEDEDGEIKRRIRDETELACRFIGTDDTSSDRFKRRLMTRLRERGFDSGLCKSRWEKTGRFPAGTFEYVDVIVARNRYVVQVSLAGEFTIARPSNRYVSLLQIFPQIFVGKPEKLKQILRLMCAASNESLKSNDILIPPWRRNGYMQAKWLGSYKRTTNSSSGKIVSDSGEKCSVVGFETPQLSMKFNNCRGGVDQFEKRKKVVGGLKVGKLSQALNGM